ncbi:MAG: S8 family serine peptidase [Thiogranum sp.]
MAQAAKGILFEKIRAVQANRGTQQAREMAENFGFLVREERGIPLLPVIVDRSAVPANINATLKALGGRVDASSRSYTRLLVPFPRLQQLSNAFPNLALRTPFPVQPVYGLGTIVSESVPLTAADGYQAGNLTGAGIRVAVVDLGFSNLSNAISQGELPAGACDDLHSADFTGSGLESGTVHGTGVAEHVIDMAPGVELHCLKVSDQLDLENAAAYIRDNNIQIANHSAAWVLASYYDDSGPINAIINDSYDIDGVFWTVSSGNAARQHWRGNWLDADADDLLEFSGTDEDMRLVDKSGAVTVFLNWNQYGFNNKTDLDLYVYDKNNNIVAASIIRQSRFNNPVELVNFTFQPSAAPYQVQVERVSGSTANLDITLFSFDHDFEHPVASSSLMDPASAHGAFTVGAVNQAVWQNPDPAIRGYSSQGPSTDGRQKPDIVAPDGTASLTYGVASGTSFSAPTTAGAAALLLQEDQEDPNPALNAALLGNALMTEAIDVGSAGLDPVYGAGKLQLPLIDSDGEGLSNVEEIPLGTNPLDSDTDADGLNDFDEVVTHGTDPLVADTDADGLSDFDEAVTYGTNPLSSNHGDLAPRGAPDDKINAGDYLVLSRLVSQSIPASETELVLGDLNNNGGLDAGDLVLMMRVIQGQIPIP